VPVEIAGSEKKEVQLYVAASEKLLGVSHSKSLIENLFAANEANGIERLQALPEFKKVELSTQGPESPILFSFVSASALIPVIDNMTTASKKDDSDEQGEGEKAAFDAKSLPFEAIAFSQGISDKVVTRAASSITPKTENQKTIFNALSEGSLPSTAKGMPKDMAVALALDTKALGKLDPILDTLKGSAGAEQIEQLKTLQGFTLGVRNNDGGSPIPEILLTFQSKNRDGLAKSLEGALGAAMQASGQQAMWMTKDISGTPTRYFTTLLGVGLFIGKPANSDTVILASSERAVKDTVAVSSGSAPAINALAADSKKNGALYLNFSELANVVDSAKSSLAMFTGGSDDVNKSFDSEKLRKMGVSASSFGYKNGVLVVESIVGQPGSLQ
jgi:hypothetical protein